jgi:hypothetical protein
LRKLTFFLFCKPPVFFFNCFILSQPTSTITVFVVRKTSRFAFTINQNASFCYDKIKKNFLGRGCAPPHTPPLGASIWPWAPEGMGKGSCPLENYENQKNKEMQA